MGVTACSTTPAPVKTPTPNSTASGPGKYQLADKVQFLQTDNRWKRQTLGGTNESLENDGCLVTAAAMALVNLGFRTDPGDLTNRLKAYNGFTKQGWLIWSGLERATDGKVKTVFTDQTDDGTVRSCLAAGYYPLVKFDLPSRRSHWAVVVKETKRGFYVRDPMVSSSVPVPLKSRANGIDAIRCIGVRA
jgi:hypothetical protein